MQVTNLTKAEIKRHEQGSDDSAEKLAHEISQLQTKKEEVLDAFFDKSITKEEMRLMNERYDRELSSLQLRLAAAQEREHLSYETARLKTDVKNHIQNLFGCQEQDEVFYKSVLHQMIVYHDRKVEVRLNLLPNTWKLVLESMRELSRRMSSKSEPPTQFDPSVPISVNRPFNSG